jgi:N-succinyldiaminopimelate aminotransferase
MRLAELLAGVEPGQPAINIAVGEPQHPIPPFVGPVLAAHLADFGRYPANAGTERFRQSVAGWINRRYHLARPIDPATEILVLAGTREGLFLAAIAAKRWVGPRAGRPAILIPNPFYAVYAAGAVAAECEPVYLDATVGNGFLPDLDALDPALLARTAAFYLASPANPQGSIADRHYLDRLIALARRHGFVIFADECYSEIYAKDAPPGMLEQAGADFANVVVFHSLSKRSSLPGLRIGFAAGDKTFIKLFLDLRSLAAPQVPVPAQEVAIAAYNDEAHVEENRALYRAKFDLADQIIGNRYGYKRPPGGFFLWLDVTAQGGSEAVTLKLWKEAGLRVLPGNYAARAQADGLNPGDGYIRIAMVQNRDITAEALHRLVAVLG